MIKTALRTPGAVHSAPIESGPDRDALLAETVWNTWLGLVSAPVCEDTRALGEFGPWRWCSRRGELTTCDSSPHQSASQATQAPLPVKGGDFHGYYTNHAAVRSATPDYRGCYIPVGRCLHWSGRVHAIPRHFCLGYLQLVELRPAVLSSAVFYRFSISTSSP